MLLLVTTLMWSFVSLAQNPTESSDFKKIFFDNGSFPLKTSNEVPSTLKDYFVDSVFTELSMAKPKVECKTIKDIKTCDVMWLSAKYVYVSGEKPKDIWRQEDDCVNAVKVQMKNDKVFAAEVTMEMCGW